VARGDNVVVIMGKEERRYWVRGPALRGNQVLLELLDGRLPAVGRQRRLHEVSREVGDADGALWRLGDENLGVAGPSQRKERS